MAAFGLTMLHSSRMFVMVVGVSGVKCGPRRRPDTEVMTLILLVGISVVNVVEVNTTNKAKNKEVYYYKKYVIHVYVANMLMYGQCSALCV